MVEIAVELPADSTSFICPYTLLVWQVARESPSHQPFATKMIFKKRLIPAPPSQLLYEWPNDELDTQELWINLNDWQFKVFPSLNSQSFGTWMLQFEGTAATDPVKGLDVCGDVEELYSPEPPSMFKDCWRTVPDRIEGYCAFYQSADKTVSPRINVTLYCQPSAIEWVCRAFSLAVQSRIGSISVQLQLDCPNNVGDHFWRDQWRKESLRIVSWGLFTGAKLR